MPLFLIENNILCISSKNVDIEKTVLTCNYDIKKRKRTNKTNKNKYQNHWMTILKKTACTDTEPRLPKP